jgi:hypothetical protein
MARPLPVRRSGQAVLIHGVDKWQIGIGRGRIAIVRFSAGNRKIGRDSRAGDRAWSVWQTPAFCKRYPPSQSRHQSDSVSVSSPNHLCGQSRARRHGIVGIYGNAGIVESVTYRIQRKLKGSNPILSAICPFFSMVYSSRYLLACNGRSAS